MSESAVSLLPLALGGFALALGLGCLRRAWRRLDLAADAAHELRGPLTAIAMLAARLERDEAVADMACALEAQLARASAALADFDAARTGLAAADAREAIPLAGLLRAEVTAFDLLARRDGRRVVLEEVPPVVLRGDRRRLAQALGNLIQNAVQHGTGDVRVGAEPGATGVRLVVSNERREEAPARAEGRGMRIAARASQQAGGRLMLPPRTEDHRASIEMPVAEAGG